MLCVFLKSSGKKLAEYRLPAAPIHDGMAVSGGQLYLALKDGTLICFASKER